MTVRDKTFTCRLPLEDGKNKKFFTRHKKDPSTPPTTLALRLKVTTKSRHEPLTMISLTLTCPNLWSNKRVLVRLLIRTSLYFS